MRQDFKKERSNGTTRTRKTTTWLKAFYLTVNTKRILFCSSAVDQMGQRKTLLSCPFASRFSSLSTQAVVRQFWACVSQKSGYSGTVKTEKTKTRTMERYQRLLLRRTSNYITATTKNNKKRHALLFGNEIFILRVG